MLSSLLALGLGSAAVDGLAVRSTCSVHFTADGAISGMLGEISSGQVRAGDGVDSTSFELDGDKLYGEDGKGCWWTPPTKVLQCDKGQSPDSGWSIGCDGSVSFNGQTEFYECDTGDSGQYNVYLEPNGENCGKITLSADGCHAECPPPGCPTDLSGTYEFPHLIVPVDSSNPDKASGTSYFGEVSSTISSIFNFDIPASDDGKTCSLVFLFPEQKDLETSSFTFSGGGKIDFTYLNEAASQDTTYNNQPGVWEDFGTTTVAPGNSYSIATFDCPAGEAVAFEMKAADDTDFRYFEDYNPSPIGLYITVC